jgi:DNA-binding XRE family transcriptional regulator
MNPSGHPAGADAANMNTAPSELFRLGRLGMGWSETELARTLSVPEQTVRDWESGIGDIPPKVAAWVCMYARGAQTRDTDAEGDAKAA